MGLSNQEGHLTLATGNKSELATGYSTIYGDSVGGFAPLKDVPKTLVWELANWRNAEAEASGETAPIPPNSISKPPSAELRPGQVDQDSLPPYETLDAILGLYVEGAGAGPAHRGGLRRGRRRQGGLPRGPGGVEAPPVRPRPKISAPPSGATAGCPSRAGGASRTLTPRPRITGYERRPDVR